MRWEKSNNFETGTSEIGVNIFLNSGGRVRPVRPPTTRAALVQESETTNAYLKDRLEKLPAIDELQKKAYEAQVRQADVMHDVMTMVARYPML